MPNPRGPGVRIFMQEADFKALLDKLEELNWDHPVRWRIQHKWSEHLLRSKQRATARNAPAKRAARRAS